MSIFSGNGSGNPMLREGAYDGQSLYGSRAFDAEAARDANLMTMHGAASKTLGLLAVVTIVAGAVWSFQAQMGPWLYWATIGGSLLGCVLVMICGFVPKASGWLALPVAVCEGSLAGGASVMYSAWATAGAGGKGLIASMGAGIVLQAVLLTIGIAGAMLIAYATRLIKVTEKFRLCVTAAILGIAFVSIVSMVLSLFGVRVPYLWDSGIVGILFSGFVVVTASMTLALDFDRIESGARAGAPRHMEWYSAIALLVTLVWLYVSILRLLAQLANRK